jgi:hypothetical protein
MATRNDVNTPAIALVGFLAALLFFASIIFLQVVFYRVEASQRTADNRQPPLELTNLIHNQQARLAEYRWVDEKKGAVAIPIDRAMNLVVAELSKTPEPTGKKEGKK